MSSEITTAFVQQYNANAFHLSQQKGSLLQDAVRRETQKGKSQFFDRIGSVSAVLRVGRHSSTPQIDTPHSRRMVTMADYEWADLVDDQDKIRMLIDPASEYAMAAAWAFGRSKDDVIIASAFAAAAGGETGSSSVSHPNNKKYAANDGTGFTNLNVTTLRAIRRILRQGEVSPDIPLYACVQASQIESLLGQTEVTSSDYNSVKALVQGDIDTFMGFKFIDCERLSDLSTRTISASPTTGAVGSGTSIATSSYRSCIFWAKDGLLLSTGEDLTTKMSERDDKGYSMQVYARMSIGGTRMEEPKVIEVACKES